MSLALSILVRALLLVIVSLCICNPAFAQRVSINGIDGKLDRLLQGSRSIDSFVMLQIGEGNIDDCGGPPSYIKYDFSGQSNGLTYVVPVGHVLLIHDISYSASPHPNPMFFTGEALRMELRSSLPGSLYDGLTVYRSPLVKITAENKNSLLGTNESLVAGVAVGPGRVLCGYASARTDMSGGRSHRVEQSILRGYLVPYNP